MGLKPEITNQFTASTSSTLCLRLICSKSAFLQLSVPACKQVIQSQTISCELAQLHSVPSVRRGHIWPKLSIRPHWWGKQSDLHHDLAHCIHVHVERHRHDRMLLWHRYYTALLRLKWQCSFQREFVICLACGLCLQGIHPYINNSSLHHRSKEVLMFPTDWASTVDNKVCCVQSYL